VRLFVAAYPPPGVLADFMTHVSGLAVAGERRPGESVRLVPPQRVHLTLVFLGDVGDDRLPAVSATVAAGAKRWADTGSERRRAGEQRKRPVLRIGGGGRFGRAAFTTMWAGIRGDTASLTDLVTDLRRELRTAKLPFDVKAYRPHITIARPGDRLAEPDLAADLEKLSRYEGPEWTVESIDLVRSTQGPSPTYESMAKIPL
jgi:2'-5' RNA ligase